MTNEWLARVRYYYDNGVRSCRFCWTAVEDHLDHKTGEWIPCGG